MVAGVRRSTVSLLMRWAGYHIDVYGTCAKFPNHTAQTYMHMNFKKYHTCNVDRKIKVICFSVFDWISMCVKIKNPQESLHSQMQNFGQNFRHFFSPSLPWIAKQGNLCYRFDCTSGKLLRKGKQAGYMYTNCRGMTKWGFDGQTYPQNKINNTPFWYGTKVCLKDTTSRTR